MQIARQLIAEEHEKKTGFLDLGNLGLHAIPVALFELTHLSELSLGPIYPVEQGVIRLSGKGV